MSGIDDTPGYDKPAVERWMAQHVPALVPPLSWSKLAGGHSNLTYLIKDSRGITAVVRRPPLGQLLPKAHDMRREWSLISALGPTPVPVPRALGLCDDDGVTGAVFYVMGFVDGHPLHTTEDTERWLAPELRTRFAHSFMDVLADLHSLDSDEIGLGNLGKRDGYVSRQLSTWRKSWLSSVAAAQYDDPRADELFHHLTANIPAEGQSRVVHGDYGPHNVMAGADGRVAAVVDWEISALGDPLADLAYALNQWPDPLDEQSWAKPNGATLARGFPSRTELAQRYAERTGRSLDRLNFYYGFNRWKSAMIVHGVYARYMEGKKSSEGVDLAEMRRAIDRNLTLAQNVLAIA